MVDNTESINELNERIRELNDTLSTFSSSMQTQMRSMSGHTQALGQNTNLINQNNTAVAGSTKLAEAQQTANEQLAKSQQNFVRSLDSTETAVVSFAKAVVSSQAGFGKYGSAVSSAGDAVYNFGKSFGIVGAVLGGAVKGISLLASEALKTHDNMIQMNRDITKFAGVIPGTNKQMAELASKAGYALEKMSQLAKMTESVGQNLVAFGGTAGKGALRFLQLADVGDKVKSQFVKLGVSQEDLTAMQAQYIKLQGMSGQAYKLQTMDMKQLREQSTAYAENLVKMSAITGQTAEAQQQEVERVKSQFEEQVKVRQDELKAQALDKEGRQQEAALIRAEGQSRTAMIAKFTNLYGETVGSQVGRILRSGSFDKFSGSLAAAGIRAEDLTGAMQEGAKGYIAAGNDVKKQQEALNKSSVQGAETYTAAMDNVVTNMGDAMVIGGKEVGEKLGVTGEALNRSNIAIGKTVKEREDQAAQELAAKKVADDKAAADRAALEEKERKLQEAYQSAMIKLAETIIPGVLTAMQGVIDGLGKLNDVLAEAKTFWSEWGSTIKTGIVVLGATWAAFKGFSILSSVWGAFGKLKGVLGGLTGWISKLFGGGGGPAAPGKPGAPTKGADGRYRDAQGRFASPPAAPSGGGKLAKLAKGGARLLGKLALPLTAVMAGYDAYQGFNADPKASFGGKMANAGKGVLSGLTFGLSDYVTGGVTTGKEDVALEEKATETKKANAETISKHSDTVTTDTTQRKANIEQNKKLATDTKAQMVEQTKLFKLLTDAIKLTTSSFAPFRQSIDDIVTQIGTSIMALQQMLPTGPGGSSQILETIKKRESGGDYKAKARGSSASGAYQFTDGTWQSLTKKYKVGEIFKSARDAPPEIQDLIASKYVDDILKEAGGDVSKVPLKWYTGNIQGKMSSEALAANNGLTPQMYQQKWMTDYGRVGAEMASRMGSGDIASIGKMLQGQGFTVSENPAFGGVTPGVHKGAGHADGRAIDVNVVSGDDSKDPVAAAKLDALSQQLSSNPNLKVLWRTDGHFDHMHIETKKLTAARGGVFSGPRSGYPIEMHGTEMVAPLNVDSILMKLAKTPAGTVEADTAINSITQNNKSSMDVEKIVAVQSSMIEILGNKLDTMIDALESGNKTQTKILRHSV